MQLLNNKKIKYYILSIILIIVIDQIIKAIVTNQNIAIIKNILNITYTQNYGIAFSLLQQRTVIISITILLLIITTIYTIKKINIISNIQLIAIISVLSGGISNLIDRAVRGYVIDYINIEFLEFPIFNLADIFITVGVCLLIITTIKNGQLKK